VAAPLGAIAIALTGETLLTRHEPRGALHEDCEAAAGGRAAAAVEAGVSIELEPTGAPQL